MQPALRSGSILQVSGDPDATDLSENVGVVIERSVADVWDYVSDLGKLCDWRSHLRDVDWLDAPATVGSRFEGFSSFGPWRTTRLVCQVTEWEPERHYRYEVIEGPIRADALWGVRPDGEATYFYGAGDIFGRTWSTRLLRPLAKPLLKRETQSEMLRAKEILEAGR